MIASRRQCGPSQGGEFTIASLNLENFRDGTPNFVERQQKAARVIVEILRAPDILGTIEVGDLEDLQALAALVNGAAGTSYEAYLEDGDGQSTGFEQNVGYLVNRARIDVLATQQAVPRQDVRLRREHRPAARSSAAGPRSARHPHGHAGHGDPQPPPLVD